MHHPAKSIFFCVLAQITVIGIHDVNNEGLFVYDSNNSPLSYENWGVGSPNDANGEDCVEIGYYNDNYKWNDLDCGSELTFVCEK